MRFRLYLFSAVMLFMIPIGDGKADTEEVNVDFEDEKRMVAMRDIAHRLLWYAGDSTSRVLPVEDAVAGKYLLRFESPFSFNPDSLVGIIDKGLHVGGFPSDYIVSVIDCASNSVVFGYAILGNGRDNIVPCEGREQPRQCYTISITFAGISDATGTRYYLLLIAGLLAVPLWIFRKRVYTRGRKILANDEPPTNRNAVALGSYHFYPDQQLLVYNGDHIALTAKESKLLAIFADRINVVIERNRLQKMVWEDEGVIVGRSLDMFISRLRKKLTKDGAIQLVNIHGHGYKLVVPVNKDDQRKPNK